MVDINNTNQVSYMTESCQILSDTLNMIESHVKPGQSVIELDKLAEQYILSRDAEPAFKGYNNFPSTITVSIDDEVVHGIPKDVVLKEGQIVGIDCGVLKNGYYSDSARTLAVGKISKEKQLLLDITKEALEIGISKAVVGNRVFDISDAIQKHVESKGYSIVRELVGHGIGTKLHLEPQVPNFSTPISADHNVELKEGMCLAIEPMVNLGSRHIKTDLDGWTIRTQDGQPSAHFEHSILITKLQPRILT
ncbi:MAG: type I methionyl aminopeptidase [Candidatus Neomarinimicrobiota bacterium]